MALISLVVIMLILGVCDWLRGRLGKHFQPALWRSLAVDALLAVELCGGAFEMGAILEHYGLLLWMVCLFLTAFYQNIRWREHSMPSPYIHLLDHLAGTKTLIETLLRSAVLLASGLFSYRLIKTIWSLELSTLHVGRPAAVDACIYPWQEVPTGVALFSEALGTFFLGVVPQLAVENPTMSNNDPLWTALAVAAMVVVAVVSALHYSGGMFNPMLATVLLGGCQGHQWWEHILVYWVGATVGALAAYKAYPTIKKAVYRKQIGAKQFVDKKSQ